MAKLNTCPAFSHTDLHLKLQRSNTVKKNWGKGAGPPSQEGTGSRKILSIIIVTSFKILK